MNSNEDDAIGDGVEEDLKQIAAEARSDDGADADDDASGGEDDVDVDAPSPSPPPPTSPPPRPSARRKQLAFSLSPSASPSPSPQSPSPSQSRSSRRQLSPSADASAGDASLTNRVRIIQAAFPDAANDIANAVFASTSREDQSATVEALEAAMVDLSLIHI